MNKKVILITLIVFLIVLGVAAVLYPKLSSGGMQAQLGSASAGMAQEDAVTAPPATEPATEPASEQEPTEEPAQEERPKVPVPDFTVLDAQGNEVNFSDYVGKPIVLGFWTHWCGACQQSIPTLEAVKEDLGEDVTILLMHTGPAVDKGMEAVEERGYSLIALYDKDYTVSQMFGVNAYPSTFFLDAEGNLSTYYVGFMDEDLVKAGVEYVSTP